MAGANPPPHTPEQERKLKSLWTVRIENALDRGIGSCPLRQVAVRQGLERTLRHDDGKAYLLGEFVIMPNHVHLLVRPELGVDLGELMQTWKSVSADRANVLLDRSGTFWQDEYFDHIVRDIPEWQKAGRYVRENPQRLRDGDFTSGCGMLGSAQDYLLACQSASGALSATERA